ncbi:Golgi to ER traffic 4-like protein [Micractinium conductrix]|uniref:Golgi to ER traffic 4-like protein n=1 Tax=Micractinium conductrix TaxID=554055 RepID=A0A2P6VB72_9CHLO|nr:Golgi to ER traffic 4-like protein [Micractinium conductrix]|eukprot:PSC71334.1 Golgi to ER traffic 4-like protein [Micractinium conductrix]
MTQTQEASVGTAKVLRKLEASLAAGQFYEAHEMFKTVYYRHRSRGHAAASYELAQEGARLQLQRGQLNCGVELCLLLVEAYVADKVPASEEAVARVASLVDAFPRGRPGEAADPPVAECSRLVGAAVKWLRSSGDDGRHEAALEGRLAACVTESLGWQGLGFALPHYARACDAGAAAAAVAAAVAHGRPDEEDLFLTRAALTMAAGRPAGAASGRGAPAQLAAARELIAGYGGAAGHAPPDTPLLHFLSFFMEALARRSADLAALLLQRYRPALDRDPALWTLVARCQAVHLPAAAGGGLGGMGGLLGEMMGMLAQPTG